MSNLQEHRQDMSQPRPQPREDSPTIPTTEVSTEPHLVPQPIDFTIPQLTVRAVGTGMVIGGVLSLCNIYAGLKVGWGFNMSITAALLAFGFWKVTEAFGARPFGMLENNINQTAASSAASISSAGLVAPIPALTLLTGQVLSWGALVLWTFSVCLVGIAVAVGLRRQMIEVDKLPFASGIAAAATLREMYAKGKEAMQRVSMLLGAGIVAAVVKIAAEVWKIPRLAFPGAIASSSGGALAQKGLAGASLKNLTFALDPSLLMVGVGGIIGIRASASMALGAVLAWAIVGPMALERGWAATGAEDAVWFGPMLTWLLWPGVAMMVTASLTSFAFSWRSIGRALRGAAGRSQGAGEDRGDVPSKVFLGAVAFALVLSVVLQWSLFGIGAFVATLGVLLTFVLAIVSGRVSGETGITPVGAMGKVTQLVFGVVAPGQAAPNLMAANVTGGAASQCADLLHDLKTGHLLGAVPRLQAVAQFFGAMAGALLGSFGYLIIVRDPSILLTDEWPAPAVAAWKAVAEIFMKGLEAMPAGAMAAMAWAGAAGIVLAVLEKVLPGKVRAWVPSPASLGLAFVIPAYNSISMLIGAVAALVAGKVAPGWAARFAIVLAAGLIAGESITGVAMAVQKILVGG
ncbi:MAG TPA: OPT family oligopeptide transporter [Vulgatibacter sp.]|nr:OPT family oligopeptide transporter [Vulgatibacter sp.]